MIARSMLCADAQLQRINCEAWVEEVAAQGILFEQRETLLARMKRKNDQKGIPAGDDHCHLHQLNNKHKMPNDMKAKSDL